MKPSTLAIGISLSILFFSCSHLEKNNDAGRLSGKTGNPVSRYKGARIYVALDTLEIQSIFNLIPSESGEIERIYREDDAIPRTYQDKNTILVQTRNIGGLRGSYYALKKNENWEIVYSIGWIR